MANAFAEHSGRRVDWLHIPVLDRSDDAYFEALADLEPRGAKIYLGMIHNMDRFAKRHAAAKKYLSEFGLAAYCGLGRESPSELPVRLEEHLKAAEIAGF